MIGSVLRFLRFNEGMEHCGSERAWCTPYSRFVRSPLLGSTLEQDHSVMAMGIFYITWARAICQTVVHLQRLRHHPKQKTCSTARPNQSDLILCLFDKVRCSWFVGECNLSVTLPGKFKVINKRDGVMRYLSFSVAFIASFKLFLLCILWVGKVRERQAELVSTITSNNQNSSWTTLQ
jgi:hypothetical protein